MPAPPERRVRSLLLLCALGLLGGCAVIDVQRGPALSAGRRWALLPIRNHGEAPRAGERVEALVGTLLRTQKGVELEPYPVAEEAEPLADLDGQRRYARALAWARARGLAYAVTGSVAEWRYRGGPAGEPAVGVSLSVLDPESGRVLWSASGARAGLERETVSGVAQGLLRAMVGQLVVR